MIVKTRFGFLRAADPGTLLDYGVKVCPYKYCCIPSWVTCTNFGTCLCERSLNIYKYR